MPTLVIPVRMELKVSALGRIPRLSISSSNSKAFLSMLFAIKAAIPTLKDITSGTTPLKPCRIKVSPNKPTGSRQAVDVLVQQNINSQYHRWSREVRVSKQLSC